MIGHLGGQRSFQNGFGQLFQQTVFPDENGERPCYILDKVPLALSSLTRNRVRHG
jgi:hypothetical protein